MARNLLAAIFLVTLVVVAGCIGGTGGQSLLQVPDNTSTVSETTSEPTNGPSTLTTRSTVTPTNGTLEVHFINVGQSLSTLIVGPTGETMLIDTGDWRNDGEYVLDYLQARNITRIDYLVSSHGDADHIGGNAAIIEYYETEAEGIGAVYDQGLVSASKTYERYLNAVEEYNVTLYRTQAGDTIPMEGVGAKVLAPPEGYLETEERNENSIVIKLTHGNASFLFTGDAEDEGERYLVETYGERLQATVLKAGHHGSKSSTSGALLDAVDPQVVVISSAYESQYGHPHEEVLERLEERSIPTYWTATHGHVVLTSTGKEIRMSTQQAAPTAPREIRTGEPIAPETDRLLTLRTTIYPRARTDSGTATATIPGREGELKVTTIRADAKGDDRSNLNDEYLVFTNTGDGALAIGSYTISDESGKSYTIPEGVVLELGESVALHTGAGTNTATDLYWDAGRPVWNNGGDTITVQTTNGTTVLQETY